MGSKVNKDADKRMTVNLHNGAEVAAGEAIVIMGRLEHLCKQGLQGQILLADLYHLCRGHRRQPARDTIIQGLIGADLLREDGSPSEAVKHVVLSAVVIPKGSEVLKLRQPYPKSPENTAAMNLAVDSIVGGLGMADFFGWPGNANAERSR